MCFRSVSATVSRCRSLRRRQPRNLSPLAMLDLSKPGERQAHDFLCRATSGRERMWELLTLRRKGDALLCIVRWVYPDNRAKPFSLAEVSLSESAVHWRYFVTARTARAAMEQQRTACSNAEADT